MVQSIDDCIPKSDSDTSTRQPSYLASHHHRHYHRHVHHGGSRTSKIPIPVSPTTRMQYNKPSTQANSLCFGYRMPRQGKAAGSGPPPTPPSGATTVPYPLAQQAQRYLEQNIQAWLQPSARDHTFSAYMNPNVELPRYPLYAHIAGPGIAVTGITQKVLQEHNLAQMYQAVQVIPQQEIQPAPTYLHSVPSRGPFPHSLSFSGYSHHSMIQGTSYSSPCATGYALTQPSAAASFFARAAQRLNLSSKKKRHDRGGQLPDVPFRTCFHEILRVSPPPAPPGLLRVTGRKDTGIGKVKVMLRLCRITDTSDSFLTLDSRKKQVTVYDPSSCGTSTPAERRAGVAAPKMFAFDAVFSQDDTQAEVCSSSLTDVVQSVVNGNDGCLFVYGHSGLGKTYTMLGNCDSVQELGVIPCALTWLFKLINEHKQKTGARFSVRVSAVEVSGRQETLKDLLSDYALGGDGNCTSPGVYLRDDPIFGSQLMNQSELRAPTAEKAAYLLDAAVAARSTECEEDSRNSHFLFTLHVYQYRVEKGCKGGVAGGRSRLHLFDLGSCEKQTKGRDSSPSVCLSLSALGNVILALFNGQKHVPYKDSKLTQVLREALGGVTCRAAMIAHVSSIPQHYAETLATIQLAARVHRMRRKKFKYFSPNSGEGDDRGGVMRLHGSSGDEQVRSGSSDPDYSSSSEQSCDTVIYVGSGGLPLSDRELTDNEGPPNMLPILPKSGVAKIESSPIKHENNKIIKSQINSSVVPTHLSRPNREDKIRLTKQPLCDSVVNAGQKQVNVANVVQKPITVVQLPRKIHVKHPLWPVPKQEVQDGSKRRSDETWVDGPRFTKAKFDTRMLHRLQKEQWVDGPAIYGYMDDQKQDMIHKWIEEHSRQPQENLQEVWVDCRPADDLLNGILEKYVPDESMEYHEPIVSDNIEHSEIECVSSDSESDAVRRTDITKQFDLLSEVSCAGICNSLQNISAIPDMQEGKPGCGDDDTSSTSADIDDLDNDYDDADDQGEFEEPVPTQDSCLQVTEEDILSALLAVKEQFGDFDLESFDGSDHPLHILSEEDLNLASSFTDSCSVSVDLETISVPDTSPGVTWALLQGKLFQKSNQITSLQHRLLAEKLKAIAGYHDDLELEDDIWMSPGRVSKTCSLPAHLAQLAVSQLLNRQEPDLNSICSEPTEMDFKKLPWYIQSHNGLKWDNKLQRVSLSVDHAFHAKPTQIVPPLICLTRDHNKNVDNDSKFCDPQITQTSNASTIKTNGETKSSIAQLKNLDDSLDSHLDSSLPEPKEDKLKPGNNEIEVYSSESPRSKPSRLSKFLGVKNRKEKCGKKRTHRSNDTSRCTLSSTRGQGSDSDTVTSGYPSPYTKAWVFRHSSSGHGSDSSLTSTDIRETKELLGKSAKVQQFSGTSSGYESMPRDSEGTPLSSSSQESSGRVSGKKDGRSKGSRKKDSNKRSRSAPARQSASPRNGKKHPSLIEQQPAMTDAQQIKAWNERTATRNEEEACCSGLLCCRFLDFY